MTQANEKPETEKKVGLSDLLGAGLRVATGLLAGNTAPIGEAKKLLKKTADDVDAAVNTGASAKPLEVQGEEATPETPEEPAKEVVNDER